MTNPEAAEFLSIGDLARRTGLNVSAIRYYEEVGLIAKAARRPSGHRVYRSEAQAVLSLVRNCRAFGFSLDQVRTLVSLSSNAQLACDATRDIAQEHLHAVQAKLAQLQELENSLTRFIQACSATCVGGPAPKCTILKDIGSDSAQKRAPKACC